MNPDVLRLGDRQVGPAAKVFVVAEIGINHDGSREQAHRLIDAAADSGADAVKFQTFCADRLMVPVRDRFAQQMEDAESAFQLFKRMELSREAHEKLKRHTEARGILFLSTPFDEESADFLDNLGIRAFKIASSDITHMPLLRHVASKRKPVLLSTGMSDMGEIAEALSVLKSAGTGEILLLHCVSVYPAPPESLNLRSIRTMLDVFNLPVGYSDHSEGVLYPLIAVVLGAVLLEKHFTLDRCLPGPDHRLSMEPAELRQLVTSLRELEASLGDGCKSPTVMEEKNRRLSRRSIVASLDIQAGQILGPGMLAVKRPGTGLEPRCLPAILGRRAVRDIRRDTIIQWTDVAAAMTAPTGAERNAEEIHSEPAL